MSNQKHLRADPYRLLGEIFDKRYELVEFIASGGFGAVYRAVDRRVGRTVAVKILKPDCQDEADAREMFQREARAVARLTHPHIVAVTDEGEHSGIAYLIMEWLEGHTLEQELKKHQRLSLQETAKLLADITSALQAAHEEGVIHRDLKPSNIHLGKQESPFVKVLDFGIAKVVTSTSASLVSRPIGTLAYMSPEQFNKGGKIDARSDIYSLGVMSFQLLSGELPFKDGDAQQVMLQHLLEKPPRLYDAQPSLGRAVSEAIERALAKNPDERQQSVAEFYREFIAALREAETRPMAIPSEARLPLTHETVKIKEEAEPDSEREDLLNSLKISRQHEQIIALLKKQEYGQVIIDCNEALRLNPHEAGVYSLRGLAYGCKQEHDKAIIDLNEAVRLDPDAFGAYLIRGLIYVDMQDCEQAITDLSQAMRLGLSDRIAYFHRGNSYFKMHRYDQAIADYTEIIRLDESDKLSYFNRGVCYCEKHDYSQAISDWTKTLSLDPNYVQAYSYRASAYRDKGEYENSIEDYTKALSLDPSRAEFYFERGNSYYQVKKYEEAIDDYKDALRLDPNDAATYLNCGVAYLKLQQCDEALAYFIQTLRIDPDNLSAHFNRGLIYGAFRKEHEKAIADFTKVLQLDPMHALAYALRGNSYLVKEQYDEAFTDFMQSLRLDPNLAMSYRLRGKIYLHEEKYDKAIADYNEALRLDADADVYSSRGIAYYAKGEYEKAIADWTSYLRLHSDTGVLFLRAHAYNQLERYDKSIGDYNEILRIDPYHAGAYNSRGLAYSKLGKRELAEADFRRYEQLKDDT